MTAKLAELVLPYPPPWSACYAPVKGRGLVKTKRYKTWQALAVARTVPRPPHIPGRVDVAIQATPPDNRKRDADNTLKATFDFLTLRQIIDDDSCVESLFFRWWRDGEPGIRVQVTPHQVMP